MSAPIIDVDDNLRLLGTAHVATASVEAVKQNIEEWKPDIVAVELCKSRHDALTQDKRLDREGLLKVIKEGKAPMVLLQSLLAAEQRKLGLDEGQQPGAELLAAVEAAEEYELRVELVDRDIQTTLRRAWKNMSLKEKTGLMWALLAEDESNEELELEQMLEDKDLLTSLMEELREYHEAGSVLMMREMNSLRKISGILQRARYSPFWVLVIWRISKLLEEKVDASEQRIAELSIVPKGGRLLKSISYGIPLVLLGLLGWFIYNGDLASIKENGIYWFAGNFIGAALFCMLAGGHPVAILVAALASPITSLNPALGAGWFAGYAEMKVKEPSGEDLTFPS